MLWRVDPGTEQSFYEQIAGLVRGAIARGDLVVGERLPSARELAADLGVNMHTVLRAYRILRDEGLLQMRPSRGVTVVGTPPGARLLELARLLAEEGRRLGMSRSQIQKLVAEAM